MKTVHRANSVVNWIGNRGSSLTLTLILGVFLLVTIPTRSVQSNATKAHTLSPATVAPTPTRSPTTKNKCTLPEVTRPPYLAAAPSASTFENGLRFEMLSVPPGGIRIVPNTAGLMFQGQSCRTCGGKRCAHEDLCCPSGWSVVWTDGDHCCAQCCVSGNCGQVACCYMF